MIAVDEVGGLYTLVWPTRQVEVYNKGNWSTIEPGCHLSRALQVDPQGFLWGWDANQAQLCHYDGGRWIRYAFPELDVDNAFRPTIRFDEGGRLWSSYGSHLLVRHSDHQWHYLSADELPLEGQAIIDVAFDRQGRLWLVSSTYLAVTDGTVWQRFVATEAGLNEWVDYLNPNLMAFDLNNQLWLPQGRFVLRFTRSVELPALDVQQLPAGARPLDRVWEVERPEDYPKDYREDRDD
jgi:hypothetical protein